MIVALASLSAADRSLARDTISMESKPLSHGDFSTPRAAQDDLQAVWVDFLERNFASREEAAMFFGVDESSIRHWKSGRNGLNATRLVKAAKHFPALRQMLFGGAE